MILLDFQITDKATPILAQLSRLLTDRTDLNSYMAAQMETLTRNHMRIIDPTMHTTRQRLGVGRSNPPSYWEARIRAIESRADDEYAVVSLGREAEIFARLNGPVEITPREGKYLTIPVKALSFGRRAREFAGLFPVTFKKTGKSVLARKGADGKLEILYALKEKVTLPQDRELLPSNAEYLKAVEDAAKDYVETLDENDLA